MERRLFTLSEQVGSVLRQNKYRLVTAESCTGGWVAKVITDVSGSSQWFECGFITYSNAAKKHLLNVKEASLQIHGAVSREVVIEMGHGALANSNADVAVAISGVAGPSGGNVDKPTGTVWVAWLVKGHNIETRVYTQNYRFNGDREMVRYNACREVLEGLVKYLS